ncbi:hypothetical protein [Larkinella punicea]|uniref:Lipocalin-like domain-containing protein n=1 Tax=Larkinella punicea TaxID=2315727 RepID=A0A368JQT3_9BACT|nr:hypothetical protein [Larkinella punicea]RCR70030.1 hypothetical protein DUE52_09405 [Larkinella punicea]
MKKILVFLFVLGVLAACKKDNNDDPKPDQPAEPAAKVAGTYKLSSFHFINGANEVELEKLPVVESGKTVASGTVKLTKKSDGKVVMNLNLVIEGEGTIPVLEDLEVEVRESGKVFGLYADGERIGDADGDFIIFNVSGTSETGDELLLSFNANK